MDSPTPATSNLGTIARTITKLLRFRRTATSASNISNQYDGDNILKLKTPPKLFDEYPPFISKVEDEKQQQLQDHDPTSGNTRKAMEFLIANLFASISAVKASYAQLQVAQLPYDPETIQSADQAVVSELKHLSELKQSYIKNELDPLPSVAPPLTAQIQEHHNLIKTYQITAQKLESELKRKSSEVTSLRSHLMDVDRENGSLEARLYPGRSLSSLDNLHLSGLNATHFLIVVRFTVRSIRSFVRVLVSEMQLAGWDLNGAAATIQADVIEKPNHWSFAFESFVSQVMFSRFHLCNFGLSSLEERGSWEEKQFFDEFSQLKSVELKRVLTEKMGSSFAKFLRARYLGLVHPKMEAAFFGDLDHRSMVSSGRGFPESVFFAEFAEMARRVWLLHCLFFSFGKEMEGSIFQMRRGCRFSDVYMESVLEEKEVEINGARSAVGFTVSPGFRVGRTVIPCKVYLDGRSR